MKKRIVLLIIAAILLIPVVAVSLKYNKVYEFCLEDYSEAVSSFSSNFEKTPFEAFGEVNTAKDAKKIAEIVFNDFFRSAGYYGGTFKPYKVSYDSKNQVWLVQATKFFIPGAGAHVIIDQKQGTILAIWNTKF